MHPRHINYLCDLCLFLPFIGIFLSVYFSYTDLETDIKLLKPIFDSWNNKPLHILQQSESKSCKELGMSELLIYEWPGTKQGCLCENKTKIIAMQCTESQLKARCRSIEQNRPYSSTPVS